MKVERVTVEQLYALPGFEEMIAEYATHAIKKMPTPLYRKEAYLPLEEKGILAVWCAMYGGYVVGFASCLLSMIPHYGCGIAIAESLFVRESVRMAGFGIRLIEAVENHGREAGMPAVFFSCPIGSEFKKVLEHRNYSAETTTYVKML